MVWGGVNLKARQKNLKGTRLPLTPYTRRISNDPKNAGDIQVQNVS